MDCVILTPCRFGLVSDPLSLERPLPFELPALFLQLPQCRECDRNSIGCKGLKEHALDQFIHRQGADLLAQSAASLALVGSAAVSAFGPVYLNATPAAPANSDALQLSIGPLIADCCQAPLRSLPAKLVALAPSEL